MSDGSCLKKYDKERVKKLDYVNNDNWDIGFDERWSKLLSKKLEIEEINEAQHGGSNDRIIRMTMDWCSNNKSKLKDTLFVIGWTSFNRFEFWDNFLNRFVQVSNGEPTHNDRDDKRLQLYVNQYWKERHNDLETYDKLLRKVISLQSFFKSNNLSFLFVDAIGNQIKIIKEHRYESFVDKKHWWNYDEQVNSFSDLAFKLDSFGIDYNDGEGHPGIEAHEELSEQLYVKVKNIL
jgi:hypothetical protein|tara:strand:+ start:686 stop:1390 length:705 start_codon:yes stop_codon:yes gene_type:complete